MKTIRIGISTCPNDTFAFAGLLAGRVTCPGLELEFQLLDIQQLNDRLFRNELDVAKVSFHAALRAADKLWVLPSGSALGFGVGPLLLAGESGRVPSEPTELTLTPGQDTTAHLLFSLFYPHTTRVEQVVFSEIMPKLQRRQADFGVCIHEGRFTWQQQGLHLVEDLGSRWERDTQCPLPLGGIVAGRHLDATSIQAIQDGIRQSLELAQADPASALPAMRQHAQEFDDRVLMKHVELYVNEWTRELGAVGRQALQELNRRAKAAGVLSPHAAELEIYPAHA